MSHRLRSWNFHTKVVVPENVAKEALSQNSEAGRIEVLLLWGEASRSGHHFKRGDTCCHVDNLEQVMHVDKIIRTFPKPVDGEKQKARIEGILVHWMEEVICPHCGNKI